MVVFLQNNHSKVAFFKFFQNKKNPLDKTMIFFFSFNVKEDNDI